MMETQEEEIFPSKGGSIGRLLEVSVSIDLGK